MSIQAIIHPTAVVHPAALIGPGSRIGPFAVIDQHVQLGADCEVGPHVFVTGWTRIGAGNRFHAGCVIGDAPQDLKYQGAMSELHIGERNIFREHVTVHRSNSSSEPTRIGSNNFFLAHSHIGHNARVGDQIVLANGALLGGHVTVGDRVFISGNCLVHQFVRIGGFALMQGGSAISKDLPPFTVARGDNGICGLNVIGLRRAGFTSAQRLELKRAYRALFRSAQNGGAALRQAREQFTDPLARELIDFVAASKRGVCADTSAPGEDDLGSDD